MNCPQCGMPLETDSLFCSECGYHLSDAEAAQAMQTAQAMPPMPSMRPTPSTYPASAAQASPIPQPAQQSGIPTQPLPIMPGLGASLSNGLPNGLSNSADANASAAGAAGNPPAYASYATSSGVRPPASAAPGFATTTATATGLTRGQKIIVALGGMLAVLLIVLCVMLWMSMSGSSGAPAAGSSTTSQSSESGASGNADGSSKDSDGTSDGDASSDSSSGTSKNSDTSNGQNDDSDKADSQYGSASEPPSSTLKSYSKNGFTVSVPDNFKEYGTSTNESPGYTFTGSGMEITAWRVADNGASSADELARLKASAEVDVAYELDADPSVYVSYERDGDIYYIREIVSDEGIIGVQLRYPKAHRSMYDSLTETIPPTLTFTE